MTVRSLSDESTAIRGSQYCDVLHIAAMIIGVRAK